VSLPAIAGDVVIHEIHYAPGDKTVREEFVELFNHGAGAVDLSGWFLGDGISYVFPAGTTLAPGGYTVIAEDPATLANELLVSDALGPYDGQLSNEGERIVLRNATGGLEDEVTYNDGTPWPVASSGRGSSLELVHPDLDNDLSGSWRPSGFVDNVREERLYFVDSADEWHYRPGTSEPPNDWREIGFVEDATWSVAQAPIGFGDANANTLLPDMQFGYTSVFVRREFTIGELEDFLQLGLYVDDGCVVSINGVEVFRFRVADEGDIPFDGLATRARRPSSLEFFLDNPLQLLKPGKNVLAIHALNVRASSNDFTIDATLFVPAVADFTVEDFIASPTPGVQNTVRSTSHPPQVRQIDHAPAAPGSGEAVVITTKVTDPNGVGAVELEYQLVDPGAYIRLTDELYLTEWTVLPMKDDGAGGDKVKDDGVFTATLGGELQTHRRLIRYRVRASDGDGNSTLIPFRDDPQPNFAYFVYDGVPAWQGVREPSVTEFIDFSPEVLTSLPVYHLLAATGDPDASQYSQGADADHFPGTLVYKGIVYDHIEFENRGEFSTYVSGKNKWKFHFNRSHEFQARDNFGRLNRARRRTVNLSACATPWVPTNRGMAGLGQAVAHKTYGIAGMPSPDTHYLHFRVIDEAEEFDVADQYHGDLWGLYLSIEHTDEAFLKERGLPDGNAYKIEGSQGDKRNQGRTQSLDSSDYNALRDGYNRDQSVEWWRANVNLASYYSFRGVGRVVNNMDLREGWNLCQYHNPETGLWSAIPWDLDMLYMPLTHWSGIMHFQNALSQHEIFAIEYRNRARELGDLLFSADQFRPLVEEITGFVSRPGTTPTFAQIDEAMWNHHPRTAGRHVGAFYRNPSEHGAQGGTITRTLESADHTGMAEWIMDFAIEGYGQEQLSLNAADESIPAAPRVTAAGAATFPIDDLRFTAEGFEDPDGNDTFGGIEWRMAEVTPPGTPSFAPETPRLFEIEPAWVSGLLDDLTAVARIPTDISKVGGTYRIRARMHDNTGRASHWSEALEFVATPPTTPIGVQTALRITEIMYNSSGASDFEFIELQNTSAETLSLDGVRFTDGIRFDFSTSVVKELPSGAYVVLVKEANAFHSRYGSEGIVVGGEYMGNLSNGGEPIAITYGANTTILEFPYDDAWVPSTDGDGHSLVARDPQAAVEVFTTATGWTASRLEGGSPGHCEDNAPPAGSRVPADMTRDERLNISDALVLLDHLFLGGAGALPCDGGLDAMGNQTVADFDGDATVQLGDVLGLLEFVFRSGPPHVAGLGCVAVEGCSGVCR
jgi:hypothetical protein